LATDANGTGRRRVVPEAKVRDDRVMDAGVTTGLVGVGGTALGAGLGYLGTRRISRVERETSLRGEKRRAYAAYLGALYPVVSELRDMPAARRLRFYERWLDQLRGEAATWTLTRRHLRRTVGDRPGALADRLAYAVAQLQVLPLPQEVSEAVAAANNYIERLAEDRSSEVIGQWPELHKRLLAAADSLG
jgi:hypothetical protein